MAPADNHDIPQADEDEAVVVDVHLAGALFTGIRAITLPAAGIGHNNYLIIFDR